MGKGRGALGRLLTLVSMLKFVSPCSTALMTPVAPAELDLLQAVKSNRSAVRELRAEFVAFVIDVCVGRFGTLCSSLCRLESAESKDCSELCVVKGIGEVR